MVKKLFALASVTALSGLIAAVSVAGCSSSTTVEPGTDSGGGGDAKVDSEADPAGRRRRRRAGPRWCVPAPRHHAESPRRTSRVRPLVVASSTGSRPPRSRTFARSRTSTTSRRSSPPPPRPASRTQTSRPRSAPIAATASSRPRRATTWSVFIEVTGGAIDNSAGLLLRAGLERGVRQGPLPLGHLPRHRVQRDGLRRRPGEAAGVQGEGLQEGRSLLRPDRQVHRGVPRRGRPHRQVRNVLQRHHRELLGRPGRRDRCLGQVISSS